jgi:hypothetical protein
MTMCILCQENYAIHYLIMYNVMKSGRFRPHAVVDKAVQSERLRRQTACVRTMLESWHKALPCTGTCAPAALHRLYWRGLSQYGWGRILRWSTSMSHATSGVRTWLFNQRSRPSSPNVIRARPNRWSTCGASISPLLLFLSSARRWERRADELISVSLAFSASDLRQRPLPEANGVSNFCRENLHPRSEIGV